MTATDCTHRWIIATPSGAKSEGVCSECGEVRKDFNNVSEYKAWQRSKKPTPPPKKQPPAA